MSFTNYHHWYYETEVWERTTWLGVKTYKAIGDLWNYQELIEELRPGIVVEFGTARGGSALFFACVLELLGGAGTVLSVDIDLSLVDDRARAHPRIELLEASSIEPRVAQTISVLRAERAGPLFAVLDSDHRADHVLAELELLAPLMRLGDYVVVEDGNVNGHPVLPGWGPGPMEAIERFHRRHPGRLRPDAAREGKFGLTFAPRGYLRRSDA